MGELVPEGQGGQVVPLPAEYLPAGHERHIQTPIFTEKVPAGHAHWGAFALADPELLVNMLVVTLPARFQQRTWLKAVAE